MANLEEYIGVTKGDLNLISKYLARKEYSEWSRDMDSRVKQVEQEEIESEESPNSNS